MIRGARRSCYDPFKLLDCSAFCLLHFFIEALKNAAETSYLASIFELRKQVPISSNEPASEIVLSPLPESPSVARLQLFKWTSSSTPILGQCVFGHTVRCSPLFWHKCTFICFVFENTSSALKFWDAHMARSRIEIQIHIAAVIKHYAIGST